MLPWLLRIWRQLPAPLRLVYLRLRYGHFGIGVAALIRDPHGRILLVHRTYSHDEPWALPGGWLELGNEAVEAGLERELLDATDAFRASPEVSELAWVEPAEVGQLSHVNARLLWRVLA